MGRVARPAPVGAAVARVGAAMEHAAHLDGLQREGQRVAALVGALASGDPVPTRPGATVGDVAVHLGSLLRAAIDALAAPLVGDRSTAGGGAATGPPLVASSRELEQWLRAGVGAAVAALSTRHPHDAVPVPFPARPIVASWSRRLCHEIAACRVDLALAAGGAPSPVDAKPDPSLASDAIDEHLTVVVPHGLALGRRSPPSGRLAITCPEPASAWVVSVGAHYEVERLTSTRAGAIADATLAGPAPHVLGVLLGWRGRGDGVVARGDERVLDGWTAGAVSRLR
jgi:hypothetical protein